MDLANMMGVAIKLEVPDDPPEAGTSRGIGNGAEGTDVLPIKTGQNTPEVPAADSIESPSAQRPFNWSNIKCVFCNSCLSTPDKNPKLMECLHSACEGCIRSKMEEKMASGRDFLGAERITVACPSCKLECCPGNLIDHQFVIEKLNTENTGNSAGAVVGEQHCNSCSDENIATSYCVECAEFICDVCVQAHQRLKITKDHTIKSKEEASGEMGGGVAQAGSSSDMFCREHTQERLSLFCETCDRLTCRDCQLLHHRDHKYQFSSEMCAQARVAITNLLSEVSYKRVLLGSAMKVIKDRQALIADKKKALVHEITQTVVKLTEAINTRGKQLVLRLNEVCDEKQKVLNQKKQDLELLSAITDHCITFVNAALEQGSDTAVLYTKKQVTQHLKRIKSRRADIPNPEIPVRISLALDKVPDLIKVLSMIGGIVVDGKMDGGPSGPGGAVGPSGGCGAGSHGPYHPPPQPAQAPPAQPPQNHSAVAALQHQVAMQQSYAGRASGGASPVGGPVGGPPPYSTAVISQLQAQMHVQRHTPNANMLGAMAVRAAGGAQALRHPHVTSTTHPHHMQVQQQRQQQYVRQNQAMQQAYQQVMGAYASGAYAAVAAGVAGGRSRSASTGGVAGVGMVRAPSPAPPAQSLYAHAAAPTTPTAPAPAAKWHIPQHQQQLAPPMFDGGGGYMGGSMGGVGGGVNDFKIMINRQPVSRQTSASSAVTSTNPKTPSPSLNGLASSEATVSIDKLCAESVQDLMATIAKLDSNGVQVLPEHAPAPSPHVHSSTDDSKATGGGGGQGAGDPNEDWCAVCMDGGELMCCDKCPKVFHQYCHIPTIDKLPEETETWQCLLCVNFASLPPESAPAPPGALSPRQQKIIERIVLELYCQYETSLPFREPVPLENVDYHSKISRPMALDNIRMKLQPGCVGRYSHVSQMVADVRLMFKNAYAYNAVDSQIYKDAKRLEEFFDQQLEKLLPEYAYYDPSADEVLSAGPTPKRIKMNGLE